jgi:hypothetical protein
LIERSLDQTFKFAPSEFSQTLDSGSMSYLPSSFNLLPYQGQQIETGGERGIIPCIHALHPAGPSARAMLDQMFKFAPGKFSRTL